MEHPYHQLAPTDVRKAKIALSREELEIVIDALDEYQGDDQKMFYDEFLKTKRKRGAKVYAQDQQRDYVPATDGQPHCKKCGHVVPDGEGQRLKHFLLCSKCLPQTAGAANRMMDCLLRPIYPSGWDRFLAFRYSRFPEVL